MPRREGEDDLLAEAKRAMRMKVQMDLLGGMGILREERGGGATLDASEILMLMSAVGRRDEKDEVDLRGMLPYIVVMRALGGEKSSDWEGITAALVSLARRKQEVDPLALLDLMEKAERGAREEERERWMALAEALRRRRPPEEGSTRRSGAWWGSASGRRSRRRSPVGRRRPRARWGGPGRCGCRSGAPDPLERCAGPLSTDDRTVVQKRYKCGGMSRAEDENR